MAVNKNWRKQFFGNEYIIEFYKKTDEIKTESSFCRDRIQLFNISDIVFNSRKMDLKLSVNWRSNLHWNSDERHHTCTDSLYDLVSNDDVPTSQGSLLGIIKCYLTCGANSGDRFFEKIHGYFPSSNNGVNDGTLSNLFLYGGRDPVG